MKFQQTMVISIKLAQINCLIETLEVNESLKLLDNSMEASDKYE